MRACELHLPGALAPGAFRCTMAPQRTNRSATIAIPDMLGDPPRPVCTEMAITAMTPQQQDLTTTLTDDARLRIHGGMRLPLIVSSYTRLTGRQLVPPETEPASALWAADRVIVAHGTESDPVFFYGNRLALELFEMRATDFICLPSRLSAEPLLREERLHLLERVSRCGYIDDYAGIRISSSGRRFRIEQATVWNLIDAAGKLHGQAATFRHWTVLK